MDIVTMSQILTNAHWTRIPIGFHKTTSNGKSVINPIQGFLVYVRKTKFDDFLKKSSNAQSANPYKISTSSTGSISTMGVQKQNLNPSLADFQSYPSLASLRSNKPCILIGYDSEWQTLPDCGRDMLSWQFVVVYNDLLYEFCFLKDGFVNLSLELALGCILDYLDIGCYVDVRTVRRYKYCSDWQNGEPVIDTTDDLSVARNNCKYVYRGRDIGFTNERIIDMGSEMFLPRDKRDWAFFTTFNDFKNVDKINVTIVCHAGKVDVSGFNKVDYYLTRLTDVHGGLVSLQPFLISPKHLVNVNNTYVYPITLTVADTMCHAPAGKKSLENLGNAIGVPKYDIPKSQKSHMRDLLDNDPLTFFDYASTDSVVTLLYCSALYGFNNTPPVTITAGTASVMKGVMMSYLGIAENDNEEFNKVYRGVRNIKHGTVKPEDRPVYLDSKSLDPISDRAKIVQLYASDAYHGGYNSCSEVGYFRQETFDYDLRNAYPTAMCLIPDIDWNNPIRFQIQNRFMDIRDFHIGGGDFNPIMPFVCYCRFEFPNNVKFPCIPVTVDGVPVYPRTSEGMDGVYVAGPFIYLALRLGAKIWCENGYFLNTLLTKDLTESRCLSAAVIQLVRDRNKAIADHGKKSLEELILKTMVSSGYGKTSQNVIQKSSWTAFDKAMKDLGCSPITNPVSAMMTTSIVQCELLAAQNQLSCLGYITCSVTTDGFISDCPFDVLKSMDLYGFSNVLAQARLFLTDGQDPVLWEMKHHQNDLLNFTTRGNVSLLKHGVCAHNSAKSIFESDSRKDRLWLMTNVLSRTGTIDCVDNQWTSFKEMVLKKCDFNVKQVVRHLHMDFDLKRKPIRDSFTTDYPVINGLKYEIAHFDTEPYNNIAEFRLYRKKKASFDCLRTESEWQLFFMKVDTDKCPGYVKDLDWNIINSIIMGFRGNLWDIPALSDKSKTVAEKCVWINKHNDSNRSFKESDWKNARKSDRISRMLDRTFYEDKLLEMQSEN